MVRLDKHRWVMLAAVGFAAWPAIAQQTPALDLPQLSMPAAPQAVMPALPATPQNMVVAPAATGQVLRPSVELAPDGKPFSFGGSDISVLFLSDQIRRMKEAVRTYESVNRDAKPEFEATEVEVAKPVIQDIKEPPSYPVFYLSSIAYDAPGDWSIWVGGHKITSRKNESDVTVLAVSRDSVTFSWRPEYAPAIAQRLANKQFAATDPVKNKLAVIQRAGRDAETGTITFTLRQNQSFAVGYFSIFEGYVESPKLSPIVVVNAAPANTLALDVPVDPETGVAQPGMQNQPGMMPGQPGAPSYPGAVHPMGAVPGGAPGAVPGGMPSAVPQSSVPPQPQSIQPSPPPP